MNDEVKSQTGWPLDRLFGEARRALAVLLREHHISDGEISRHTGFSPSEIQIWHDLYQEKGPAALIDGLELRSRPAGAEKPKFPESVQSILSEHSRASPYRVIDRGQETATQPAGSSAEPPGLWRTVAPTDERDPVPDDAFTMVDGAMGWIIVGASRRGLLHAHEGKYREDTFKVEVKHGWHLAAVADGAGSAQWSRVGARLAVEAAVEFIGDQLPETLPSSSDFARDLAASLEQGLLRAAAALREEADRRQVDNRELASTLLLLAHRPSAEANIVGVGQIGDGLIVSWGQDRQIALLAEPNRGEYAGETRFLTHIQGPADAQCQVNVYALDEPPTLLLAMTDGVADDFYPPQDDLTRIVLALENERMGDAGRGKWLEFIQYRKRGSVDDRTLVALFPPHYGSRPDGR